MVNLPGVFTIYKERKPLVVATPENNTDEILLFGTATDGPVLTPITISRPSDVDDVFGKVASVPSIGSAMLVPAAHEAYYAGCRKITCVRISGVDASKAIKDKQATPATIATLYGKYPGDKYNDVNFEITADELKVWNVADILAAKTAATKVYTLASYATITDLANAVNTDSLTTDVRMVVAAGKEDTVFGQIATQEKTTLVGGDDELAPTLGAYDDTGATYGTGYRGMIAKAYDLFLEYDADLVVPVGLIVGFRGTEAYDKEDGLKLAKFCFDAASRNNDIIGAISAEPLTDTSLAGIAAYVNKLATVDNTFVLEGIDLGRYLCIAIGEPVYNDSAIGAYANLPAAGYFGLASKLPVQSGTTNKVIPNSANLRFNFSPSQTETLRNNKFTVLRYKLNRGVVVIEGLLASLPASDFQALSTVRIIHAMMDSVRQATDAFIGEPLDIPHVNSIETAIRDVIRTFATNGAISSGTFQLFFGGNNAIVGDLDVELELEIPSELRRILVTVSRRFPEYAQQQ